jgi:hypothetical protein
MNESNYIEKRIPLLAEFTVKDAAELANCKEAVRALSDAVVFFTEEPVADGDEDLTAWDRHERGENDDLPETAECIVQRTSPESHFGPMYVVRILYDYICVRFLKVPADLVTDAIGVRFSISEFRYGIIIGGEAD